MDTIKGIDGKKYKVYMVYVFTSDNKKLPESYPIIASNMFKVILGCKRMYKGKLSICSFNIDYRGTIITVGDKRIVIFKGL